MIAERRAISPEERIQSWIALGADPAEARWQAALAAALDAWRVHLISGRIVTSSRLDPAVGRRFEDLCIELDLPPEAVGVFLPPALSGHFEPPPQGAALRRASGEVSQLVLLAAASRPQRLLVAELASSENAPGVDVFEKGCRIAAMRLEAQTAAALSALAWQHLGPASGLSRSACRRYTEWWFQRCAAVGRADLPLHEEFSYIHHSERLGMDTVAAVFRLAEAVLPECCDAFSEEVRTTGRSDSQVVEAVEARLLGLLDLLRKYAVVDFGSLRGEAETRFKEAFGRTVERTSRRLLRQGAH